MAEQTREQRLVDGILARGVVAHEQLGLLARRLELTVQILPFAQPQVVEVLALAQAPEGTAGQFALLLAHVVPQVEVAEEVALLVLEPGVLLIRLGLRVRGALTRILDRHRRDDDEYLPQRAVLGGGDEHASEPRVDGQAREGAAGRSQLLARPLSGGVEGVQFLEQRQAVLDLAGVGRVDEREARDVAEAQGRHLQDDAREVRPQDLGVGELRAGREILLRVQPDADAVGDTATPAGALTGGGLRDRLDRQTLHLRALAVARDARGAGVDDVADARHRQRRLGDVRRQDDASPVVRGEDAMLLGGGQARIERHDLDVVTRAPPVSALERVRGVADLALTGAEDEDVLRRTVTAA